MHVLPTADPPDRSDPPDRIFLRDHVRAVDVGAFQEERGRTQRLRFALAAEVAPAAAAVAADDVDGILSYDLLVQAIDAVLAEGRWNLLEALAERVAARVLSHPRAARLSVRIEKLDRGPFVLGVEITRTRGGPSPSVGDAPRPRVAVISPDAADLVDRLEALAADGPALLVAVPGDAPAAAHPLAQRRIDLLAVEQAAWRLAARDPRCLVVDTRTELDHALRTRALTVWAPSRVVLAATDAPSAVTPAALARWIGAALDAVAVEGA